MKNVFKSNQIYCGIDMHLNSMEVQIALDHTMYKRVHFSPPSPYLLGDYLVKHFPSGNFVCGYEAGFSGYHFSESLKEMGIQCLVIHPADIPTTDKEKRFKTDKLDCIKIAKALRSELVNSIYLPPKQLQKDRSLVRIRYAIAKDVSRIKNRISAHLHFYGISKEIDTNRYWSKRMIGEIEAYSQSQNDQALIILLAQLKLCRSLALKSLKALRELSNEERYKGDYELLRSIPGVGPLTAIVFLTEVGDINRFKSLDHLISYIGLTPRISSSGEKEKQGPLSRRGNKALRTAIVLSSWMSIRNDSTLALAYENYRQKMIGQKAIIKIARKLVNRMRSVLLNQKRYQQEEELK